jgi:hypothetical protein
LGKTRNIRLVIFTVALSSVRTTRRHARRILRDQLHERIFSYFEVAQRQRTERSAVPRSYASYEVASFSLGNSEMREVRFRKLERDFDGLGS